MNWIQRLPELNLRANKYSQYGEEIVIASVFENIGTTNKFFVDIGAGGAGRNLSNTRALEEKGWVGLKFDMDGSIDTIKAFITPGNIIGLLLKNNCPREFDFLSVDIDSFDYDVIDRVLTTYKPRLICAEYNGTLDPLSCVKLKYEPGYTWDGTNKYGFSYGAGLKLFSSNGYTVIHNHKDTNMFAIQNDLLPAKNDFTIRARQNPYHPINPSAKFIPA